MKTSRITKPADEPTPLTRGEADAIFGLLDAAILRKKEIQAEIDAAALKVRQSHEKELASLDATIDAHTTTLRGWSRAVRRTLFPKGAKSLTLTHGTVGFRTGQPTVGFLKGWTEEQVIAALEKTKRRIRDRFLRTVVVINREAVISRRHRVKLLAAFGMKTSQTERFFVEPKLESAPEALKEAA